MWMARTLDSFRIIVGLVWSQEVVAACHHWKEAACCECCQQSLRYSPSRDPTVTTVTCLRGVALLNDSLQ